MGTLKNDAIYLLINSIENSSAMHQLSQAYRYIQGSSCAKTVTIKRERSTFSQHLIRLINPHNHVNNNIVTQLSNTLKSTQVNKVDIRNWVHMQLFIVFDLHLNITSVVFLPLSLKFIMTYYVIWPRDVFTFSSITWTLFWLEGKIDYAVWIKWINYITWHNFNI